MIKSHEFNEKRKQPRFVAKENAFVVLDFDTEALKLGRIGDISESGLSFYYEGLENWPRKPNNLDILFGDDDFYLERLPFHTVSDEPVTNETPFSTIKMRRHSIRFESLTAEQKKELDYFIWHLTTGTK